MKPIIVIDDKVSRLKARQHEIKRAGYSDYVEFGSEVNFVTFDENANVLIDSHVFNSGLRCIFIHSSLKSDSKFPESSVSKIRLTLSDKSVLVVGFSGGSSTDFNVPKLNYEDFERGLITFTHIIVKYDVPFLRAFTKTGMGDFAIYLREESKRLLQAPYNLPVAQVIDSKYFKALLKYAGESLPRLLEKYDLSSLKPSELGKICNQLSEKKKL